MLSRVLCKGLHHNYGQYLQHSNGNSLAFGQLKSICKDFLIIML